MRQLLVLNGPNLNLLGKREPQLYGATTLADLEALCTRTAARHGLRADCRQSNREYELIDWIHEARDQHAAIVINAGAYSHTSIAILDALNAFDGPVIEVHITNIHRREPFRHHSHVSARADALIAGAGVQGYAFAIERVASLLDGTAI
ncbi:3-dehydroquinate dehydratase [Albidovulum inexpectatum]|uniref:3-dehydroquinate dehydratase n=1 Tax=Albidovulum inexpectatum TaxID=196587 RepID=A0A2S5JE56_9RHOB|nr:type II 3-dehydroquinate dehydratase [Albidovulum inexpectatum]PPB79743.1 3-dehydroquinate dehydratase [Albidovulum inexpectatum]